MVFSPSLRLRSPCIHCPVFPRIYLYRRMKNVGGMRVDGGKLEVWYDGACPLCLREIALMRRLDRRGAVVFTDVSTPDSLCPIDRKALLERFHARENGVMVSGAAAFAAMWRAIPWLRPLGLIAPWEPVLALLEWAYLRFLKVRPRLQGLFRERRT